MPGIIEWPSTIKPRIANYAASTMDIFPTIADMLDLSESVLLDPVDGISLVPLFDRDISDRKKPIPFRYRKKGALIDNNYKLVTQEIERGTFELYNLESDPTESSDVSRDNPEILSKMKSAFLKWNAEVDASVAGEDYPEGRVVEGEPSREFWWNDERYEHLLDEWKDRPEYAARLKRAGKI